MKKTKQAMDFSIDLTEFPSAVHRSIYSRARIMLPLSLTLDAVADPAMRKSCAALHGFVTAMLSDMYDNPDDYFLPVMKLEEYISGRNLLELKRESPQKYKDAVSQTHLAAGRYMDMLWWIGDKGTIEGSAFVISAERLRDIGKRVKTSTSPIPLEKRLEALNRVGFNMEALPKDTFRFTSKNYPDMFPALHALRNDFLMFDFRNMSSTPKPTHEDFFYALSIKQRELANELHDFAMERKMRLATNANWGVLYHHKSKHVMTIRAGDDISRFLGVRVIGKDSKEAHTQIDKYIGKESADFKKQVINHLSGCDANTCLNCSTYSSGNYVTVLGKRHQMCGTGVIGFDWRDPVPADMKMIKRLIEIRCQMIDDAQLAKKAK